MPYFEMIGEMGVLVGCVKRNEDRDDILIGIYSMKPHYKFIWEHLKLLFFLNYKVPLVSPFKELEVHKMMIRSAKQECIDKKWEIQPILQKLDNYVSAIV
jgi:hypothetical protein